MFEPHIFKIITSRRSLIRLPGKKLEFHPAALTGLHNINFSRLVVEWMNNFKYNFLVFVEQLKKKSEKREQ